jgi:hypothetical protein
MITFSRAIDQYCNTIGRKEYFQIDGLKMKKRTFKQKFISVICEKLKTTTLSLRTNQQLAVNCKDAFRIKIRLEDICYLIDCVFINTTPELEIEIYTQILSE